MLRLAILWCALAGWSTAKADCTDLSLLHAGAALGQLTADALSCLEARRGTEPDLLLREAVSELLLADAFAKGDHVEWARHAAYHLEHVDRADPELMYQYGMHLVRYGSPENALIWADKAEEHAYGWDEKTLPDKLYNLQRLRARAAWAVYLDLKEVDPEGLLKQRAMLGKCQLNSVRWLRHAQANDRDITEALDLCEKTGWSRERCLQQAAL